MPTSGLITITKKGSVVMKIITGSGGHHIMAVAEKITPEILDSAIAVHSLASKLDFGDETDLVVSTKTKDFFLGDNSLLPERYRTTFELPEFNPRSDSGESVYFELIAL